MSVSEHSVATVTIAQPGNQALNDAALKLVPQGCDQPPSATERQRALNCNGGHTGIALREDEEP